MYCMDSFDGPVVCNISKQARMFYNEEIAESCPDTAMEPESDGTEYFSNSINYITGLGSGWLGNVWEKAKEQSSVAISATKRDLTEFVTTIHRDTSNAVCVVGDSAIALTEKIVQSADGFGSPEHTNETAGSGIGVFLGKFLNRNQESTQQYTPFKERLRQIQTNLNTYTEEPDKTPEYTEWDSSFSIEAFKERISELLVENSEVKKIHSKLVPSVTNYSIFWKRYFYWEQVIRKEEERSQTLMNKETEYGWDSDSDIGTPTNDRKKFNLNAATENPESPSSSISFQQIGSPDVADIESDDSKDSPRDTGSSADSFVSIEEPDESVQGSISTKEILEQKIAMATNVKITRSIDSSADTSSDSIMVIDPQEIESVSPKPTHKVSSGEGRSSVLDYIQNMTITSPIKQKYSGKNEEWPDWD